MLLYKVSGPVVNVLEEINKDLNNLKKNRFVKPKHNLKTLIVFRSRTRHGHNLLSSSSPREIPPRFGPQYQQNLFDPSLRCFLGCIARGETFPVDTPSKCLQPVKNNNKTGRQLKSPRLNATRSERILPVGDHRLGYFPSRHSLKKIVVKV